MNIKKGEKYYISIDFDGTLFFQNRISSYNIHTFWGRCEPFPQ